MLERRRNRTDRRLHAVHLTERGTGILADVGLPARHHEDAVLAALRPAERATLVDLLRRVARDQGLTPGVHPGPRARLPRSDPAPGARRRRHGDQRGGGEGREQQAPGELGVGFPKHRPEEPATRGASPASR